MVTVHVLSECGGPDPPSLRPNRDIKNEIVKGPE